MSIYLGVNIDHIATLREARGTRYPSPLEAALICEKSGADSITLHLREDRRHIQDKDVEEIKVALKTKMNLEMAATDEMIKIASQISPQDCCLVPEKREELTTEGGLDVVSQLPRMKEVCSQLDDRNIRVSLFIDADKENYINYYNLSYQLLNKGGLMIIDNVLWKGEVSNSDINDRLTAVIKNFNSTVKEDERVEKTILPLGDGLTICRKI